MQAQLCFNKAILPKKSSKKSLLLGWMRAVKIFKTSDVIKWGQANFYNRAERTARDFATKKGGNKIERLTDDEFDRIYGLKEDGKRFAESAWVAI